MDAIQASLSIEETDAHLSQLDEEQKKKEAKQRWKKGVQPLDSEDGDQERLLREASQLGMFMERKIERLCKINVTASDMWCLSLANKGFEFKAFLPVIFPAASLPFSS